MTVRGADYARRKNDDYPTPPEVLDVLFEHIPFHGHIIDPACGQLRRVIEAAERHGFKAGGSDIITGTDFLRSVSYGNINIVTNPPYGDRRGSLALRFVEHALKVTRGRVAMLLPVDFDSGKTRRHIFGDCRAFACKLVLLDRVRWFDGQSGSVNHAWFIWDRKHLGLPYIKYARIDYGDQVTSQRRAHRTGRSAPAARRRPHV